MNRDADGARLISNRPGNRLTDPPGCIGGELIAATILKFINGLHQANVSFLNEVQELQAAISIFLRNRNNEAEIGLNHFFLRLAGFALSLLHHMHNFSKFGDFESSLSRERVDFRA